MGILARHSRTSGTMLSNPSVPYYGAMGAVLFGCVFAAINYLRLTGQITETLNRQSLEWQQITARSPITYRGVPLRSVDAIVLFNAYPEILPSDSSVVGLLRRARLTGGVFIIALSAALICLGAADKASLPSS